METNEMGMSTLSDFITGRTITKEDRSVAVVIVPATGGYPDATAAAASPPIQPYDRFVPLSLPIHGRVGDYGGFVPDRGQPAVDLLLSMTGFKTWSAFEAAAFDFDKGITIERPFPLPGGGRTKPPLVIAGLSTMHEHTFRSMMASSRRSDDKADAVDAAVDIVLDAQERFAVGRDSGFYNAASLRPYHEDTYVTIKGRSIDVPALQKVFGHGGSCEIHRETENFISNAFGAPRAGDAPTDRRRLAQLYDALHDFMHLSYGLYAMNRYFQPSANSGQNDNLLAVTGFQIDSAAAAMDGIEERNQLGAEWNDNYFSNLSRLREKLLSALTTVDAKLEAAQPTAEGPAGIGSPGRR